jgi:virginiamycin B lyase
MEMAMMIRNLFVPFVFALLHTFASSALAATPSYFPVPEGSHPHDVAASPSPNGPVYYTAQRAGKLGILDPTSGKVEEIALGKDSAPHGVVMGPDGAAWVTDGGLNAIVRYDPKSRTVKSWPLPEEADDANLNTLTFDRRGRVWFTGQNGFYGRLEPTSGAMKVWKAPRGRGPYGITTTPAGEVYYASLAGNHIAHINPESGVATIIEPPTARQGARRIWADSKGKLWVSYWNTGQVGMYDPATRAWREWKLPGKAQAYAVWVDEQDKVWLTDFGNNALVRFDLVNEAFKSFPSDREDARVRQLAGRAGEVWGAESGNDRLVRLKSDF